MNNGNQCHPKTLVKCPLKYIKAIQIHYVYPQQKSKPRSDKPKPLKAPYDPETLSYSLTQFSFCIMLLILHNHNIHVHFIRQTVILLTESTSSCRSKELLRRQPQTQHQSLHQRTCLPLLWKASPGLCITCYLCYFNILNDCRIDCALKCRSCLKPQLHDLRNHIEMNTSTLGRVVALLIRISVAVK